jgi:hypothetical protein
MVWARAPTGRLLKGLMPTVAAAMCFGTMPDDIPFDKNLDLAPDTVDEPMPGARRVMADNPGPFTFKGTLSYIIGHGKVAIVDPGPDNPRHIGALLDAVHNETVTHIFVTHTHRDHSPAVPAIKAATGATVYAEGLHRAARPLHIGEHNLLDSSGDSDFRPDIALKDRSKLAAERAIKSVHLPFTILRPVVVYGPHARGNFRTLVRIASLSLPLPVKGLTARRSLLGIDNLVSAIIFLLDNQRALGQTLLVADPAPLTLIEIFTMWRKAQGRLPWLVYVPTFLIQAHLTC